MNQPQEAARELPISIEHHKILKNLEILEDRVSVLVDRLDNYLVPSVPSNSKECSEAVNSQQSNLIIQLDAYSERIKRVTGRIHDTIDRLEI